MKAMRFACCAIIIIFMCQPSPQTTHAHPPVKCVGDYLLSTAFDYMWEKATGKPDFTELDSRPKALQSALDQTHQSLAAPIQELRNRITSHTSKEDFQQMVQQVDRELRQQMANLERRADITEREIRNLQERIAKLEARADGARGDTLVAHPYGLVGTWTVSFLDRTATFNTGQA